jgi:hypothetical protein
MFSLRIAILMVSFIVSTIDAGEAIASIITSDFLAEGSISDVFSAADDSAAPLGAKPLVRIPVHRLRFCRRTIPGTWG